MDKEKSNSKQQQEIKKAFLSPLLKKRIKKFTKIKRGYYSFFIILLLFFLSFFAEFFINSYPLMAKFDGEIYYPIYGSTELRRDIMTNARQASRDFRDASDNPNITGEQLVEFERKHEMYQELRKSLRSYTKLNEVFKKQDRGDWAIMAIYPYGPTQSLLAELGDRRPPTSPDLQNLLGTDDRGRDVLARMVYGFRISLSFALLLTLTNYIIGITIGSIMGYYAGKIDFFGMRLIEIWSSMPFLYTVMIVSSIIVPNFWVLILILSAFGWVGMSWYMRAEFFREKSRDYVHAALAVGVSDWKIISRHILPNSLTPVISFLPFSVLTGITSLVSLDFLGFGLPAPTPSWGEMLNQGVSNLHSWWLIASPVGAMFVTLLLVTFIGEAIREAFDPKEYSRLR
ncbi:MAG: ABC transporter permease subunit [Candidatus Muiribacteriota bacterium]